MNHLSYQEQKEFFRLDKEYDKAFVEMHESKVCTKQKQQFRQGLNADTFRETRNIRKRYNITDQCRDRAFHKLYSHSSNTLNGANFEFDDHKMTMMNYAVTPKLP